MLTGLPLLESTDWTRLHHAYGPAADTPGHLLALLSEDQKARTRAMNHLWSAIIHQGTPWTATGPVALVVAGLLSDRRIDHGEPLRAYLLKFLVSVVEASVQAGMSVEELERLAAFDIDPFLDSEDDQALYENEDATNSFFARSVLGCIRAAPVIMTVMLEGLANAEPRVRACAAMGAAMLAKTDAMREHAAEVESRLFALARAAQDPDERSSHVLALGDLGCTPVEFLDDPSSAVRMCAALAPRFEANPIAINELLDVLRDNAGELDEWFAERPPQFALRPRFSVVARLIQQVKDFDRLVDAAVAVVGVSNCSCVDYDWGLLLAAAFPDGKGVLETEPQRRFLKALVSNPDLWAPASGNAYEWFKQAGLPYDRLACAKLIEER